MLGTEKVGHLLSGLQIHLYDGSYLHYACKVKDQQQANTEWETEPKAPKWLANTLTTGVVNTSLHASFPQH